LVKPIVGKAHQLIVHATSCGWLEPANLETDMREKVLAQVAESKNANKENVEPQATMGLHSPITPNHAHRPLKRLRTAESSYNQIPCWSPEIQKEFDEDFVRLLVANGNAWRMADNPQTKIWMEKWSRGPPSSGRKKLSGAVLDAEVLKAENRVREKIVGKVGTGTCDGWKNKAKKSVVSTMLMVENEVRISAAEMNVCLHGVITQAIPYGNS
jgi:hypothetical protein